MKEKSEENKEIEIIPFHAFFISRKKKNPTEKKDSIIAAWNLHQGNESTPIDDEKKKEVKKRKGRPLDAKDNGKRKKKEKDDFRVTCISSLLPNDILFLIFSFFDIIDALSILLLLCKSSNHYAYQLIKDDSFWKKKIDSLLGDGHTDSLYKHSTYTSYFKTYMLARIIFQEFDKQLQSWGKNRRIKSLWDNDICFLLEEDTCCCEDSHYQFILGEQLQRYVLSSSMEKPIIFTRIVTIDDHTNFDFEQRYFKTNENNIDLISCYESDISMGRNVMVVSRKNDEDRKSPRYEHILILDEKSSIPLIAIPIDIPRAKDYQYINLGKVTKQLERNLKHLLTIGTNCNKLNCKDGTKTVIIYQMGSIRKSISIYGRKSSWDGSYQYTICKERTLCLIGQSDLFTYVNNSFDEVKRSDLVMNMVRDICKINSEY